MQRAEIEAAFTSAGLARRIPEIDQLARNSVRLLTQPINEISLQPGVSKIGGHPDLPAGTTWPTFKGRPQSFLAQIRLADISTRDTSGLLPRQGMLWFFYDANQETFGENPRDRSGWSILFNANPLASLRRQRTPATLPAASLFRSCALTSRSELTLALQPELEIPHFDWSDKEQQSYEQVLQTLRKPTELTVPHHRVLGYPDTIQDDMRLQCQLISHGITAIDDPHVADLQAGASDWLLLLQIDSDAAARMLWSNHGMLYYWIKQADLQARHFEQNWLVLQAE